MPSINAPFSQSPVVNWDNGYVDVRLFGATGDNPASDDTAAFVQAQQIANEFSRRVGAFGKQYNVSRVALISGAYIKGAGRGQTTIKLRSAINDYILFGSGINAPVIEDLTFDGNKSQNAFSSAYRLEGVSNNPILRNVEFKNCTSHGGSIQGAGSGAILKNVYSHDNGGAGFFADDHSSGKEDNCTYINNVSHGSASTDCHSWERLNSVYNTNGGVGCLVKNADDCIIRNCMSDGSGSHNFQFNMCDNPLLLFNTSLNAGVSAFDIFESPNGKSEGNIARFARVRGFEFDTGSNYHNSINDTAFQCGEAGMSVFRSYNLNIVSPDIRENNLTDAVGGIRIWTNTGSGSTTDSNNCRIAGGRSIDARGSPTQTFAIVVQAGTTKAGVRDMLVSPNLSGTISAAPGAFDFMDGLAT